MIDPELRNLLLSDCAEARYRSQKERAQVLSWLRTCDTPYRIRKPDEPKMHLAAYAMIRSGDEFLLVFHSKAKAWIPVGGHLDVNERSACAIERELVEELGMRPDKVEPKPFFVTRTNVQDADIIHTDVTFWHLVDLDRSQLGTKTVDHNETLRWFTVHDMLSIRESLGLCAALRSLGSQVNIDTHTAAV
ncbi:MAG: NUDIX hydrolase [Alphaproteobacteria bacterium]|nr:MAG: NUDIX hydrolase [Alphaproteobacteria bacterium]